MTTEFTDDSLKEEFCYTLAKIFNVPENEVKDNFYLFEKIDNNFRNCLYYLSQIEELDLKISASLSLEFLVKFKERAI